MVGALLLSLFMVFSKIHLFFRVFFGIIAVGLIVLLIRLYISYKRKKLYFDGKVLVITPPKRKIGRYSVVLQNGKVSKKLYSYQEPKLKKGVHYVVVYEEKSFNILEVQEQKFQNMNVKSLKKNPKFKL